MQASRRAARGDLRLACVPPSLRARQAACGERPRGCWQTGLTALRRRASCHRCDRERGGGLPPALTPVDAVWVLLSAVGASLSGQVLLSAVGATLSGRVLLSAVSAPISGRVLLSAVGCYSQRSGATLSGQMVHAMAGNRWCGSMLWRDSVCCRPPCVRDTWQRAGHRRAGGVAHR